MLETAIEKNATGTLERRRRLRRPALLTAIGVLFLLLPLLNYFALSLLWLHRGVPMVDPVSFASRMPLVGRALWLAPPVVGLGLLLVSRWGWWLFLVYAPALAAYNLMSLVGSPTLFNSAAVLQTLLAFASMAYLLRRDVYAPYLSPVRRGWRHSPRIPLSALITVDGVERRTLNVSDGGCYVEWPGYPGKSGDALSLQLALGGETFSLQAGAARIDNAGVGLAFRNLDRATSDRLKLAIARAKSQPASA